MRPIQEKVAYKYLRTKKKFPHVWCPGCGIGIVLGGIIRSIDELQIPKDKILMASGIGCSSRMPVYVDFNTLHTTHGRSIAFATGAKLAKPELTTLVITGDGDATAIGGNHLIHAARRNIDLNVILINNNIYGMTGGQHSPTTPYGAKAYTMPYGNIEMPFDICDLVKGAGASFIARGTVFNAVELQKLIVKAIQKKGFSLVEIISPCPTIFGRLNRKGTAVDMMKDLKERALPVAAAEKLPAEKLQGRILTGILHDVEKPEYIETYENMCDKMQPQSRTKKEEVPVAPKVESTEGGEND